MIGRVGTLLAVLSLCAPQSGHTQNRTGSAPITALASATGALAGIGAASLLFNGGSLACPTVPGARCDHAGMQIPALLALTLAGSAAGAVLGRAATGGRQSLPRSVAGAAFGLMLGLAIAGAVDADSGAGLTLSVTVPTGAFAALVGW